MTAPTRTRATRRCSWVSMSIIALAMAWLAVGAISASAAVTGAEVTGYAPAGNAGTLQTATSISFTTATSVPVDGKLRLTLPEGFRIDNGDPIVTSIGSSFGQQVLCRAITGTLTALHVVDRQLTIARAGGAAMTAGTYCLQISPGSNSAGQITLPHIAGSYTAILSTRTNLDAQIESGSLPMTIAPGAIADATVIPADLHANVKGDVSVSFTTINDLPNDGSITVQFPEGFDLADMGLVPTSLSMDGTLSASHVGNLVTITRNGDGLPISASQQLIFLTGIRTPEAPGATGTFDITTSTSPDAQPRSGEIDAGTAPAVTVLPGAITLATVVPSNLAVGATGAVTVKYTAPSPLANNGSIKITFPAGFDVSGITGATFATNILTDTPYSGTARVTHVGQVVTITRQGDGTVTLSGPKTIVINGITNPLLPGVTDDFTIQTSSSGIVRDEATGVTGPTIAAAPEMTTSLEPSTSAVGALADMTLHLATSVPVPAHGTITVTFPAAFDLSAVGLTANAGTTPTDFDGCNAVSVDAPNHRVIITRTDCVGGPVATRSVAGPKTLLLTGIRNPNIGTIPPAVTSDFAVTTTTGGQTPVDIESGTADGISIVASELTAATLVPSSLVAGDASGTVVVGLTTVNALPNSGRIYVRFPDGFNVAAVTASVTTGIDGTLSAAPVLTDPQTLLITRLGDGADVLGGTQLTFTLSNVGNPPVTGSTENFEITTATTNGDPIDGGNADGVTITAGALGSPGVTPASLAAGATGNVALGFTTANPVPVDGKILVTFPAGFDLTGLTSVAASIPGLDGTFAVSRVGQIVTITRNSDGLVTEAGAQSITLSGIRNPRIAGDTGTFPISTTTGDDVLIDTGTLPLVTITPAILDASVSSTDLSMGGTGDFTATFTTSAPVPANGSIKVTFPTGFDVSGITSDSISYGGAVPFTGTKSVFISGNAVWIRRTGGTATLPGAKTITFAGVVNNPTLSGLTDPFEIATENLDATTIESATNIPGLSIATGELSDLAVTPEVRTAGATGAVTVWFTTATELAANGKIKVTFPAGFNLAGAVFDSFGGANAFSGGASTSVSDQTVTITRNGSGTTTAVGPKTITLTGIQNPGVSGATGAFAISTLAVGTPDNTLDTGTAGPVFLVPGGLGATADPIVEPASTVAGTLNGNVHVKFVPANAIPADGLITIVFPAGFDVSNVGRSVDTADLGGGTATVTRAGQTVTVTRNGDGSIVAGGGTAEFTLTGINNPAHAGTTGAYEVSTATSDQLVVVCGGGGCDPNPSRLIDTVSSAGTVMTKGSMTDVIPTATNTAVGATGPVSVAFTTSARVPANGTIRITFPDGFDVSKAAFGNFGGTVPFSGTATAAVSGQTVTITRNGGTATNAGAKTVTLTGIVNPTVPGDSGPFDVATTNASGTDLDGDTSLAGITITSAATLDATVTPASLVVGAVGNVNVSIQTLQPLPTDGAITIEFPSGFDLTGLGASAIATGVDGCNEVAAAGQIVTITRVDCGAGDLNAVAPAGTFTFTLTGIGNPAVTGSSGTFPVATTTADADEIETDAAPAVTIVKAALTATAISQTTYAAGDATGTLRVGFTTVNTVPSNGLIKVTFPAGFDVTNATFTSFGGSVALTGIATPSVTGTVATGQTLTLTRSLGQDTAAGAKSITLGGIKNPPVTGLTGDFQIVTTDVSGAVIDGATATGITITPGALTSTSVTPVSLNAGAKGNVDVSFTTSNPVPKDGIVTIEFPAGFNLSQVTATASTVAGFDGGLAVSHDGQTVTVTRDGTGTDTPAGAQSFTLHGVTNPSVAGATDVFSITTQTGADVTIDAELAVPLVTIAPAISAASVSSTDLSMSGTGDFTATFTTSSPVPAGGKIEVTFPTGFDISDAAFDSSTGFTIDARDVTVAGQIVTIANRGGSSIPAGAKTIVLNNVTNPLLSGRTGDFTITTKDATPATIETATGIQGLLIATGLLTELSVTPATPVAGAVGAVTIGFTTSTVLPSDGKITIEFPDGFDVSGVGTTLTTAAFGGANALSGGATVSFVGQLVTITRDGNGTATAAGPKTITLTGIRNAGISGPSGTFDVATLATGTPDNTLDSGTADPIDLDTGELFPALVTPASLVAGATNGTVTVSFNGTNVVPVDGKITVEFPAGFDVSNVGRTVATTGIGGGTATAASDGQTVTITHAGGSPFSAASFVLTGINNPAHAGVTGSFSITTSDADDMLIDTAVVDPLVITAGAMTSASITAAAVPSAVGATSVTTVSFTTTQTVPANGKIRITFPEGFDVSGATVATLAPGTSGFFGPVSTSVNGQTVTITRLGVSTSATAGDKHIAISGVVNPVVPGLTGTFDVATTTAAGVDIDGNTSASGVTIASAATLTATVTPASLIAGDVGDLAVSITSHQPIPADGTITLTFPSGYDLTGLAATDSVPVTGLDGCNLLAVQGQSVTITRIDCDGGDAATDAPAGELTFTLPGVGNPILTGSSGTVAVATTTGGLPADIETGTAPAVTLVKGVLTATSVTLSSPAAGDATGDVTVGFTTVNPIPVNGKVKITFPDGFDVSGVPSNVVLDASASTPGVNGTASADGHVVTVVMSGGAWPAGAKTITLTQIKNPPVSGTTGDFPIVTTDSSNIVIDGASAAGVTINPGALSFPTVVPTNLGANHKGDADVTFTTVNPLPVDGKVSVIFPAGFDLSQITATATTALGIDGNLAVTVEGQTVTVARVDDETGSVVPAATLVKFTLHGVRNPYAAGNTGAFDVTTTTVGGVAIDHRAAPLVTLTPQITDASVSRSNTTTNAAAGTFTATFTTSATVARLGKIKITFPSGFDLTGVVSGSVVLGGAVPFDGTGTASVDGQVVTISRNGVTAAAPGPKTITLSGVKNPAMVGLTGAFGVGTFAADGTTGTGDIATGITGLTIGAVPLTNLSAAVASNIAGATTRLTLNFTTVSNVANNGKIIIQLPDGFSAGTAPAAGPDVEFPAGVNTNFTGAAATVYNAGTNTITIFRMGGFTRGAGTKRIVLTNIINLGHAGTSDPFTISTATASDQVLDSGEAAGVAIVGGTLSEAAVTPASLAAGAVNGDVEISVNALAPVPDDGIIKVLFPNSFDLSGLALSADMSGFGGGEATVTADGQTVIITRDGTGSATGAGDLSLIIGGVGNPLRAGTTGTFQVSTGTAAGDAIEQGTALGVVLTAGALANSEISQLSAVAGATTDVSVSFDAAVALIGHDKVKVTFPLGYDVSGIGATAALTGFTGASEGAVTQTLNSQIVTVDVPNGATTGAKTVTFSGVGNPRTVGMGEFFVATTTSGGVSLEANDGVNGPAITAAILDVSVSSSDTAMSSSAGTFTASFWTSSSLQGQGSGANIRITFPDGFDVSNATFGEFGGDEPYDGTPTVSVDGQVVTITRTTGTPTAAGDKSITLTGIANPGVRGQQDGFEVATYDGAPPTLVEESGPIDGFAIGAGAITNASVSLSSTLKSQPSSATVTFTTGHEVPLDGSIAVTFPAGFNVARVNFGSLGGALDGPAAVSIDGRTVIVTRSGTGTKTDAGVMTLVLTGIGNPATAGATGTFAIQTADSATIDQGNTSAGVTITSPAAPPAQPPAPPAQPAAPAAAPAASGAPAASVAPSITGTASVGSTITCNPGTWSGSPTMTYQWTRNNAVIAVTTPTYRIGTADGGRSVVCIVTATNAQGTKTVRTAAARPAVAAPTILSKSVKFTRSGSTVKIKISLLAAARVSGALKLAAPQNGVSTLGSVKSVALGAGSATVTVNLTSAGVRYLIAMANGASIGTKLMLSADPAQGITGQAAGAVSVKVSN